MNWRLAAGVTEEIAALCPTGALEMYGKVMTVGEVMDIVEKDASMYRNTGGGTHHQWWRSNVATRFCCSFIEGSPRQRY